MHALNNLLFNNLLRVVRYVTVSVRQPKRVPVKNECDGEIRPPPRGPFALYTADGQWMVSHIEGLYSAALHISNNTEKTCDECPVPFQRSSSGNYHGSPKISSDLFVVPSKHRQRYLTLIVQNYRLLYSLRLCTRYRSLQHFTEVGVHTIPSTTVQLTQQTKP